MFCTWTMYQPFLTYFGVGRSLSNITDSHGFSFHFYTLSKMLWHNYVNVYAIILKCSVHKKNHGDISRRCCVTSKSVNQTSLIQIMACRLIGTKPLSDPMLLLLIRTLWTNFSEIFSEVNKYHGRWWSGDARSEVISRRVALTQFCNFRCQH